MIDGPIPATDDEFFSLYWEEIRLFFYRHCKQDWEDKAAHFAERWISNKNLAGYDPDKGNFGRYVSGALKIYALNTKYSNQLHSPHTFSLDRPLTVGGTSTTTIGDLLEDDVTPEVMVLRQEEITEAQEAVQRLHEALKLIPATNHPKAKHKTLSDVLTAYTEALELSVNTPWKGRDRTGYMTNALGVSSSAIARMEKVMKEKAREILPCQI